MPKTKTILEQLEDKVLVGDGCWEWVGSRDTWGYGRLRVAKKLCGAHRIMWELFNGPAPLGLQPDHLCRNPGCVRPSHIEWVTQSENLKRSPLFWKTHCPRGHEYLETGKRPNGHNRCQPCETASVRRSRARQRQT